MLKVFSVSLDQSIHVCLSDCRADIVKDEDLRSVSSIQSEYVLLLSADGLKNDQ